MKPPKFMFVNKTAESDSLSHSNKQERIKIHSHVQKGRRYQKSDGGIIFSNPLVVTHPERQFRKASGLELRPLYPSWISGQAANSHTVASLEQTSFTNETNELNEDDGLDLQPFELDDDQTATRSSSPEIPVFPQKAGDIIDPFNVTCIKVDHSVHNLLTYFLHVHHPNIWHLERSARKDNKYVFRYNAMNVIQGCLHDEYNMYCLLASMNSYMSYIDGITTGINDDYFIPRAIKASQKYVQSRQPITGRMIFNIFHLGCAEWYRYNKTAAYVHLKAAKSMVDSLGGLKALDGPLVELLVLGDGYVSGELGLKPVFSHTEFETIEDDAMTAYALQTLERLLKGELHFGGGLLTSGRQEIVPADLRWIVLDLSVAVSVLHTQKLRKPEDSLPPDALHWVQHRILVIRHRLLTLDFEDGRSEAVKIALILWILQCFTAAGRKRSVKVIAPRLRQAATTISDKSWSRHEEVRLWILVMGATSAKPNEDDHKWFLQQILKLPISNLSNKVFIENTLIAVSEKLFYQSSAQDQLLSTLAGAIFEHQLARNSKSGSKSLAPTS